LLALIPMRLPDIPFQFVSSSTPGPWPDAEALLAGSPAAELPQWRPSMTPRLRFVQSIFAGVDTFPFSMFPPSVTVAGNVGAYAPFVSEHAVALILGLAKSLVSDYDRVRRGLLRPGSPHRYLTGRTALLLGFGETARLTAIRLRAFGMRIEGLSRTGAPEAEADRMRPAGALMLAVRGVDVVVDFRPLTSATRATIDRRVLEEMNDNAIYVNVGRARTVDEEALYNHLAAHPQFRAATDVWWDEDFPHGRLIHRWALTSLPNFLGTPHSAGYDAEMDPDAQSYVFERALGNLARFFAGETPRHQIDRAEYGALP